MKKTVVRVLAVALLLAAGTQAQAGFVDTIVAGSVNQYRDLSLEHVYFQSSTAGFQQGDVIVGIVQFSQRNVPGMTVAQQQAFTNTAYAVFSETVLTASGSTLTLGATAAANANSLQSILGISLPTGTVAAVFDRAQGDPFGTNLPSSPPAGATSINDYLKYIAANSTLPSANTPEVAVGFAAGDNSFLTVNLTGPVSGVNAAFLNSSVLGQTFGSFTGGFSVLENNTPFTFANDRVGSDGLVHQITLTNGSAGGSSDDPNYSVYGNPGFQDNTTFVFNPSVAVPEPASIVLALTGLAGFGGFGAFRRKRVVVA
jgi:hypothetical protein